MGFEPNLGDLDSEVRRRAGSDTPLDRLSEAVKLSQELATLGDETVGVFVEEARRAGHSWSEIGTALGVTKQAAQQKFSTSWLGRAKGWRGAGGATFNKFSDQARRVLVVAQDEARGLVHGYLGTEHILLGLLGKPEWKPAQVLSKFGVTLEKVREEVETIIGRGNQPIQGPPPFTPRAKKVIELAFREALRFGHNEVGPDDILLGLIREGEGVAAQILAKIAGDIENIRTEVLRSFQEPESEGGDSQK